MSPKPKRRSRTLWVNYLALYAAVLAELLPFVRERWPAWASLVVGLLAAVNIYLRHRTLGPVEPMLPEKPRPPFEAGKP